MSDIINENNLFENVIIFIVKINELLRILKANANET